MTFAGAEGVDDFRALVVIFKSGDIGYRVIDGISVIINQCHTNAIRDIQFGIAHQVFACEHLGVKLQVEEDLSVQRSVEDVGGDAGAEDDADERDDCELYVDFVLQGADPYVVC